MGKNKKSNNKKKNERIKATAYLKNTPIAKIMELVGNIEMVPDMAVVLNKGDYKSCVDGVLKLTNTTIDKEAYVILALEARLRELRAVINLPEDDMKVSETKKRLLYQIQEAKNLLAGKKRIICYAELNGKDKPWKYEVKYLDSEDLLAEDPEKIRPNTKLMVEKENKNRETVEEWMKNVENQKLNSADALAYVDATVDFKISLGDPELGQVLLTILKDNVGFGIGFNPESGDFSESLYSKIYDHEMSELILQNAKYININKLFLIIAYRIIEATEKFGSGEEGIERLEKFLNSLLPFIEKGTKIDIMDISKYDPMEEKNGDIVKYDTKQLQIDMERFCEGCYISKADQPILHKKILEETKPFAQIDQRLIRLAGLTVEDINKMKKSNIANFLHIMRNKERLLNQKVYEKIISDLSLGELISLYVNDVLGIDVLLNNKEAFEQLIEHKLMHIQDIVKLYRKRIFFNSEEDIYKLILQGKSVSEQIQILSEIDLYDKNLCESLSNYITIMEEETKIEKTGKRRKKKENDFDEDPKNIISGFARLNYLKSLDTESIVINRSDGYAVIIYPSFQTVAIEKCFTLKKGNNTKGIASAYGYASIIMNLVECKNYYQKFYDIQNMDDLIFVLQEFPINRRDITTTRNADGKLIAHRKYHKSRWAENMQEGIGLTKQRKTKYNQQDIDKIQHLKDKCVLEVMEQE